MSEGGGSFENFSPQAPAESIVETFPIDEPEQLEDTSNPEVQDTRTEREKTIDALVEYFGDRILQYKEHTGTILQVIDLCPPIKMMLGMGPEAIIRWIEEQDRIARETEDTKDDETNNADDTDADADLGEVKDTHKPTDDKVEKKEDKPEEVKKPEVKQSNAEPERKQPKVEPKKEVLVKKETQKKSKPKKSVIEKSEKKKEAVKKEASVQKKQEVIEKKPPVKIEQKVEQKVEPEVATKEAVVVVEAQPEKKEETPLPVRLQEEAEGGILAIKHEEIKLPKPSILEQVLEEEVVANFEEKIEDEVSVEVETEVEVKTETVRQAPTIPELIETWSELAEREPPLDQLVTIMVADISKRDIETPESVLVPPTFEVETLEESEVGPELYALYAAVQSAKKTVDQLYKAKTKEECQECVDQLAIELVVILQSLGYENPEKIVQDYMYTHPTDLLRELIYRLEYALRRRIYQEVQFALLHPAAAPQRHTQLGKVASFIMRLLLPQEQLA